MLKDFRKIVSALNYGFFRVAKNFAYLFYFLVSKCENGF